MHKALNLINEYGDSCTNHHQHQHQHNVVLRVYCISWILNPNHILLTVVFIVINNYYYNYCSQNYFYLKKVKYCYGKHCTWTYIWYVYQITIVTVSLVYLRYDGRVVSCVPYPRLIWYVTLNIHRYIVLSFTLYLNIWQKNFTL